MPCELCFTQCSYPLKNFGLKLCVACIDELSELSCSPHEINTIEWASTEGGNTAKVDSLFWYRGTVRSLIIAAKVKNDISALKTLLQIYLAEIERKSGTLDFNYVMPCPSSLWSRIHGKIDVAWFLAENMARIYKIEFIRPPRRIYWNLKKRSQTERPTDTSLVGPNSSITPIAPTCFQSHCLIIDDVVTTGTTLKRCIENAPKLNVGSFSCLTFARAR